MTQTKHAGPPPADTCVYLDSCPIGPARIEVIQTAKELREAGFVVVSDWHDIVQERPLALELVKLSTADLLLVKPIGARHDTFVKIGYAAAAGIRIIAVGPFQPELNSILTLNVFTWDDLKANHWLKLGSARAKKAK